MTNEGTEIYSLRLYVLQLLEALIYNILILSVDLYPHLSKHLPELSLSHHVAPFSHLMYHCLHVR